MTNQSNSSIEKTLQQAVQKYNDSDVVAASQITLDIIKQVPDFAPAYYQMGLILAKQNKLTKASEFLQKAISLDNRQASYHYFYAEVNRELGRSHISAVHAQKAVDIDPNNSEYWCALGHAHNNNRNHLEGIKAFNEAIKIDPKLDTAYNAMGVSFFHLGETERAKSCYEMALKINRDCPEVHNNIGTLFQVIGNKEKAKYHFEHAIKNAPDETEAHYNYSFLNNYSKDNENFQILKSMAPSANQMPIKKRIYYYFAYGKALRDVGDHAHSMMMYNKGNILKRTTITKDPVTPMENSVSALMTHITADHFNNQTRGHKDNTPIFIVGMPRSGSTLIEQIISSHSDVYGAGELKYFPRLVNALRKKLDPGAQGYNYVECFNKASDQQIQDLGADYISKIKNLDRQALRITDKMLGNFIYLGLLNQALPNATVIHSVRHPMDTIVSMYSYCFHSGVEYSYDLEEMARYYIAYRKLMAHWKDVLPANTILDVAYEDVVGDTETWTRKILDYCDMEWQDQCLEFYKNKRRVQTASVSQVREPIYKTSVEKWKRYEKHLKPIYAMLKDAGVL